MPNNTPIAWFPEGRKRALNLNAWFLPGRKQALPPNACFFKAENEHYPLMLGYKGEKVFENPNCDISQIQEKLYISLYSKN